MQLQEQSRVLLRNCMHGESGVVLQLSREAKRAKVHWADLDFVGTHSAESLVVVSHTPTVQQSYSKGATDNANITAAARP